RCLRVPIAMRRFYEQSLWIPQKFLFTNPDLHHGLLGQANPSPASHKDTIPTTEREALLALYAATDGDRWKDHEGWLGPPGTECNWYGVACKPGTNLEWRVSDLAVSENDLNGLVPGELGQLTQL